MTYIYEITGMHCVGCSNNLESSVNKLPNVKKAKVNFMTNELNVTFKKDADHDAIVSVSKDLGFKAVLKNTEDKSHAHEHEHNHNFDKKELTKLIVSAVLLLIVMFLAMGEMIGLPKIFKSPITGLSIQLVFVIIISIIYYKDFVIGFKNLIKLRPTMESLTTIGVTSSILYGLYAYINVIVGVSTGNEELVNRFANNVYLEAAGMILVHVALGNFLESIALMNTKSSYEELLALVPQTGFKQVGDDFIETKVDEIEIGDIIRVNPGEIIPLDGKVISGYGEVDEAAITGESALILKKEGDEVIGATMNLTGSFLFVVTKSSTDTTVQQIIKLVHEASNSKAPLSRLADKIAGVFTFIVLGISIVTFILWASLSSVELAFNMAISVLVISCPCSLGLATPIAVMSGASKAAKNGILIKNALAIEKLSKVDTIVFDKTGTVTYGNLSVTEVTLSDEDLAEIVDDLYSIESLNNHPLATALKNYLSEHFTVKPRKIDVFDYFPGEGIHATSGKNDYLIGNEVLFNNHELKINAPKKIGTYIHIAKNGKYLGTFVLKDEIHYEAQQMVANFHKVGIDVIMMTGDHDDVAREVANNIGIKTVFAGLLPGDKAKLIKNLEEEGRKVAMVGDGINDAPALETAYLGIAIGNGTEVAIASADIIIMRDSLLDINRTFAFGKKVVNNIKWNLFWAFFYNGLMIPIAAGVLYPFTGFKINPMIASLAMALSGIFIIITSATINATKFNKLIKENHYHA